MFSANVYFSILTSEFIGFSLYLWFGFVERNWNTFRGLNVEACMNWSIQLIVQRNSQTKFEALHSIFTIEFSIRRQDSSSIFPFLCQMIAQFEYILWDGAKCLEDPFMIFILSLTNYVCSYNTQTWFYCWAQTLIFIIRYDQVFAWRWNEKIGFEKSE